MVRFGGKGAGAARLGLLSAAVAAVSLFGAPAGALTLQEALVAAYQTNPTLAAELAQLRATNEQISQALAGYRPTIAATAQAGLEYQNTENGGGGGAAGGDDFIAPASLGITITQPIYSGGRTAADVERAENVIYGQRANVITAEQQVLLDTVTAYMNVLREQSVLELAINNERVLQRQLRAARDRFAVGETTRTDVAQAEARLAGATADRIAAEGNLRVAQAEFERLVGLPAVGLEPAGPTPNLPVSLEETVINAQANNPAVVAAEFAERAALASVDLARGAQRPDLSLQGSARTGINQSSNIDRSDELAIVAQLNVPLYQAGAASSRVREAQEIANQRRIELEETRRAAIDAAITAWETLMTARSSIQSLQAQVEAAQVALEGVQQEALVGARTVLEVLDAEQELLDARVALTGALRDEVVARYQLLQAAGRLTAFDLGLPVQVPDFDAEYQAARQRWR